MTRKEIDILLKDLCARLPYGIKVSYKGKIYQIANVSICNETITIYGEKGYPIEVQIKDCKPYFFPLSSMTKKQIDKVDNEIDRLLLEHLRNRNKETGFTVIGCKQHTYPIDWFNKNHFDYRGLIEKELAIDATGLNIY